MIAVVKLVPTVVAQVGASLGGALALWALTMAVIDEVCNRWGDG